VVVSSVLGYGLLGWFARALDPDPCVHVPTDLRENTLQDVITKLEPDLFQAVTGLTVEDFHLLVRLRVFATEQMNQAVFAFRRYEDSSLRYTGIDSHPDLTQYGLYDTVVARDSSEAA
jgi:hypothetical protein